MENSGKFLFEDDSKQWFVALGERSIGPLNASDIYEKILAQELSWAHYVWKKGLPAWQRLCDVQAFKTLMPQQPPTPPQKTQQKSPPKSSPQKSEAERIWYLYQNDAQFGPFSKLEIESFLESGKIHSSSYAWKNGMKDWKELGKIAEYASQPPSPLASVSLNKRSSPRRPLLAKILISNHKTMSVGICRDLSIGGMQVLLDQVPGQVGARLRMNISPSGVDQIEPFVAEGVIVRILEDGRGFSFRFDKLSAAAQKSVEAYLKQS